MVTSRRTSTTRRRVTMDPNSPTPSPTTLDTAWGEYSTEATRGWFARALWQALDSYFGR